MKSILDIARSIELPAEHLELYGNYKAKIRRGAFNRPSQGKLVLVSAITPTPAGEGKTTTSIGLAQALTLRGTRAIAALREPSMGPTLGMKGGGTGGGMSQLEPAMDINLHFTGDLHAVSQAHNLLAAMVDNHLFQGNALNLDSRRILWKRVLDICDRSLRSVIVGLGTPIDGVPRQGGFDITAASEVMAILCLATDIADLKTRLGRMVVGYRADGTPVHASNLQAVGALATILKDALKPNLVQTSEGTAAFVHGGPFANIAHGTNSINATRLALCYGDVVVTEAGFAFELGAEKFFNINCQYAGFAPSCTVLVATLRALKMHGGVELARVREPNPAAVEKGLSNLEKHIENVEKFDQACVVALNHFPSDTADEALVVTKYCESRGLRACVARPFSTGGPGCLELADAVLDTIKDRAARYRPLYDWNLALDEKINTVAREMYGADGVDYQPLARRQLGQLTKLGYGKLPVCVAKTQYSLSDDKALLGRPSGFRLTVREVQLAAGAGFVVPITGDIVRMPGLPKVPLAESFDLANDSE